MNAVREKEYRHLRAAASEYEREWLKRHPHTHHEAMLTARELRPLFENLRGNPFVKTPERLWDEEVVQQTWIKLVARWGKV